MKLLHALPALALFALGCRSQPPSSDNVCFALDKALQPPGGIPHTCEPEMCMDEVQRPTFVEGDDGRTLSCHTCVDIPPEQLSTDADLRTFSIRYTTLDPAFQTEISLAFDNRASLDPSLASFQQYALWANGVHETIQGRMFINKAPFEVLSYAEGRMHVRIHATVDYLITDIIRLDGKYAACSYSMTAPGSDGVPSELQLEIDARLSMSP